MSRKLKILNYAKEHGKFLRPAFILGFFPKRFIPGDALMKRVLTTL